MTSTTQPIRAPEGFEAYGHPVPLHRKDAALKAVRSMLGGEVSTEDAMSLVERVAYWVEKDEGYKALREATDAPVAKGSSSPEPVHNPMDGVRLDYSGGMRLLATLLTGQGDIR